MRQTEAKLRRLFGALIVATAIFGCVTAQALAQAKGTKGRDRPVLFLANESLPPMNFMKKGKPTGMVIEPLLTSQFAIFTSYSPNVIRSLDDLPGLTVGVEKKGLPILLPKKDLRITTKPVGEVVQGFNMLAAGQVDAIVLERASNSTNGH
ncbi:MAG: hypothetical protein P4L55_15650 [Syntrophobacteraceae bacterium]|nr:hypothetical protein [Syntrophobacteraceae bacterium]